MGTIDISAMDKAEVLARLFNASKMQGMGFLQNHEPIMTKEEAQDLLVGCTYFDYVRGRVMKVDLKGNELCTALYDRDNGEGAALVALEGLIQ